MAAPAATALGGPGQTRAAGTPAQPETRFDRLGWLAVLAAVLWPFAESMRIVGQPVHEVVFGDYALFELSALRASHLQQLLGPNAHAGFNHPGPAMFYLLAPAVRLLQPGPGLFLGAVTINAAALVATVVFLWRRTDVRVALWAAGCLNLFCLAVGLDVLRRPVNAILLILPMFLFVVLWAGSVTRVPGAWLWAAVIGSYEIQTHVTAAIFVTVLLLGGGLLVLVGTARRSSPSLAPGWWRRPSRVSGVVALALVWLPSTVELFVDHPNNWNATWYWLHHGHNPGIAVNTSLGIVVRSIAIFPFDHRNWSAPLPPSGAREVVGWLVIAAGGLLIAWLVRRRQWFPVALAGAAIAAVPLATITVSHAGGDNYAFLTGWLASVPYIVLLALGVGLVGRDADRHDARPRVGATRVTAWLALAALLCASVAMVTDLRETSLQSINQADGRATTFVRDALAQIKPGDRWVGFLIVSGSDWEVAAGVILELQRRGYHTLVDPRDAFLFGKQLTTWNQPAQEIFSFYPAGNKQDAYNAIGTPVSVAAGTVMNVWRPGASRYGGAIGK